MKKLFLSLVLPYDKVRDLSSAGEIFAPPKRITRACEIFTPLHPHTFHDTITMPLCACGCGLRVSHNGFYCLQCFPEGWKNHRTKSNSEQQKVDQRSRRQQQLRIWSSTLLWQHSRWRTLLQRLSLLSTRIFFTLKSWMKERWSSLVLLL